MAKEDTFREKLKDIFLHKDELETHFQTAFTLAHTNDELSKLKTTVVKMEKLLEGLKKDIDNRLTPGQPTQLVNAPQIKVEAAAATFPTQSRPVEKQMPSQQPNFQKSLPFAERHEEPKFSNSKVFRNNNYVDYSKFRKNPNIPDTQRIFLPHLSAYTSEETLYKYFSTFGIVVDVKVFATPNGKTHSGAVGFSSSEVARQILPLRFHIDGEDITARVYYTKEEQYHQYPSKSTPSQFPSQRRFQVFCGGIPVKATINHVKTVLGQYGKLRDVRMSYIKSAGHVVHRGFAFVDFETDASAQYLINESFVMILGKRVECKPNTKPVSAIMTDDTASWAGSTQDLSDSLPDVPPLPQLMQQRPQQQPVSEGPSSSSTASMPKEPSSNNSLVDESAKVVKNGRADMCIICGEKPQNCVLLWCGHTETCGDCGTKLKNCPKQGCGEAIVNRVQTND